MKIICPMPDKLEIRIFETARETRVPANTILLQPGQICDHLYYIEQGILCCHEIEGKHSYCTWLMLEGDIATSVNSFNNRAASTERITTVEDCILWTITWKELEDICGEFVEFRIIRQRLTDDYHVQSRMMDAQRKRPPEQFYSFLEDKYPAMVTRVPTTILSSFMGIHRSTLHDIKNANPKRRM